MGRPLSCPPPLNLQIALSSEPMMNDVYRNMGRPGMVAAAGIGSPRGIRGQAMVLFLVLAGVLCLGVVLLFDTGQAVNKKVKLVHTADAAAYSVAVQEAKALNFAAYMNRAQVANEVAISQMVSMWSWANMLHTHAAVGYQRFTIMALAAAGAVVTLPAVPALEAIANAYKVAEKAIATGRTFLHKGLTLAGVIPGLEGGLIEGLSLLNSGYSAAAGLAVNYVGGIDGYMTATDVVTKNDPKAKFYLLGKGLLIDQLAHATTHNVPSLQGDPLLNDYSVKKNGADGMDRFRNVVMGSRDEFSADRGLNTGVSLAGIVGIELGTWGGTDLVEYDRWAGMDTMSFKLEWPLGDIDIPFGWGGAQALENTTTLPPFLPGIQSGKDGGEGWYSHEHDGNPTYEPYGGSSGLTADWADSYPSVNAPWLVLDSDNGLNDKADAYFEGYRGLQAYQDVNDAYAGTPGGDTTKEAEAEAAGPLFTIYIYSDQADARVSEDTAIGTPDGSGLALDAQTNNNRITAISTAQTYFNRPPDYALFRRLVPREWNGDPEFDEDLEKGSLFSPYWQARLVKTPARLYALAGAAELLGAP